jgi:hypothetical protein
MENMTYVLCTPCILAYSFIHTKLDLSRLVAYKRRLERDNPKILPDQGEDRRNLRKTPSF